MRAVLVQGDGQMRDSRMSARDQVAGTGVLAVLALGTGGGDVRACACVVAACGRSGGTEGSPGGWAREDGQSRMAVGVLETRENLDLTRGEELQEATLDS